MLVASNIKPETHLSTQHAKANQICLYMLLYMVHHTTANRFGLPHMCCAPQSTSCQSIKVCRSRACGEIAFIAYLYSIWQRKMRHYFLARWGKLRCAEPDSAHFGLLRHTACSIVFPALGALVATCGTGFTQYRIASQFDYLFGIYAAGAAIIPNLQSSIGILAPLWIPLMFILLFQHETYSFICVSVWSVDTPEQYTDVFIFSTPSYFVRYYIPKCYKVLPKRQHLIRYSPVISFNDGWKQGWVIKYAHKFLPMYNP